MRTIAELAEIFKILGEPTRVRILQALSVEELCVCDLYSALDLPQPKVSRHLAALRDAGVVAVRREGTCVRCLRLDVSRDGGEPSSDEREHRW